MIDLTCYICERKTGLVKSIFKCSEWEINRDYLTNEQSSFTTPETVSAEKGDFLISKKVGNSKIIKEETVTWTKPFFLGVVDSIEDSTINVCDLYSISNFSIFATRFQGENIYTDVASLISTYILNDTSKASNIISVVYPEVTQANYVYIPEEYPTTITFMELLIALFKTWGITWLPDSIARFKKNTLSIKTRLNISTDWLYLKNNVYDFVNWEYYDKSQDNDNPNGLIIIDQASKNMFAPTVLGKWYLTKNGVVQQNSLINVTQPTNDTVYLYDNTATDKPTQLEIANSELSGNNYAHEISFEMKKNNNLIDFDKIEIGTNTVINYNGISYNTVLTGYVIRSDSDFVTLKFGHIRSTFSGVFANKIRKLKSSPLKQ